MTRKPSFTRYDFAQSPVRVTGRSSGGPNWAAAPNPTNTMQKQKAVRQELYSEYNHMPWNHGLSDEEIKDKPQGSEPAKVTVAATVHVWETKHDASISIVEIRTNVIYRRVVMETKLELFERERGNDMSYAALQRRGMKAFEKMKVRVAANEFNSLFEEVDRNNEMPF